MLKNDTLIAPHLHGTSTALPQRLIPRLVWTSKPGAISRSRDTSGTLLAAHASGLRLVGSVPPGPGQPGSAQGEPLPGARLQTRWLEAVYLASALGTAVALLWIAH